MRHVVGFLGTPNQPDSKPLPMAFLFALLEADGDPMADAVVEPMLSEMDDEALEYREAV